MRYRRPRGLGFGDSCRVAAGCCCRRLPLVVLQLFAIARNAGKRDRGRDKLPHLLSTIESEVLLAPRIFYAAEAFRDSCGFATVRYRKGAPAGKGSPHDSAWIMLLPACDSLNLSKASQFGSTLVDERPLRVCASGVRCALGFAARWLLVQASLLGFSTACCRFFRPNAQNIPVRGTSGSTYGPYCAV